MDDDPVPEAEAVPAYTRTNRILTTGLAVYGTNVNRSQIPRLEERIGSVKVPISLGASIAIEYGDIAAGLLIFLATVCAIASSRTEGGVGTLSLNVAAIVTALSWWAFHSTALYLWLITLMELFTRRR